MRCSADFFMGHLFLVWLWPASHSFSSRVAGSTFKNICIAFLCYQLSMSGFCLSAVCFDRCSHFSFLPNKVFQLTLFISKYPNSPRDTCLFLANISYPKHTFSLSFLCKNCETTRWNLKCSLSWLNLWLIVWFLLKNVSTPLTLLVGMQTSTATMENSVEIP